MVSQGGLIGALQKRGKTSPVRVGRNIVPESAIGFHPHL
jgi:hypothetical protein